MPARKDRVFGWERSPSTAVFPALFLAPLLTGMNRNALKTAGQAVKDDCEQSG
jgi:hypothetical protein